MDHSIYAYLFYLQLNDIKVVVPIICWECEAILHKVLAFREQVKDSYRILQTYTEVSYVNAL